MENHVFSDKEGLLIAVEIEKRGEAFYRKAAAVNTDAKIKNFLLSLAEEEKHHIEGFSRLLQKASDASYSAELSAYLSAVAADIVFPGGLVKLGYEYGLDNLSAVLQMAIASEKDSILFYTEMVNANSDIDTKNVFMSIIQQEKNHLSHLLGLLREITD